MATSSAESCDPQRSCSQVSPPSALLSAPPAGDQGTADQPGVPEPEEVVPLSPDAKGIYFINPKAPNAKPKKLAVQPLPDAQLERELYKLASAVAGPQVRVAANTLRSVKNVLTNPTFPVFLYVGQQDSESEEMYLLAAKTQQEARTNSVDRQTAYEPTAIQTQEPASAKDFASKSQAAGKTQAPEIDEIGKLHTMISSMVKETLREMAR